MSLVGTLAKVAVGVALAKGVSSLAKGAGQRAPGTPGSGSVFGGQNSPQQGGGLGDMLGGMLGGTARTGAPGGGGLQDILGQLTGTGGGSGAGGGLGGALGGMLAGQGTPSGGLGGLLDGLSRASRPGEVEATRPDKGSLGDLLNQSFERFGEPERTPSDAQEQEAALLLRAMIQAAKSDGRIDATEKQALMDNLGDVSREEAAFVNAEFERPVDAGALARDVPAGMEQQVYAMSLMGLDLDSQAEAQYLHDLVQALGIEPRIANAINEKMGEPPLYR